jgi:glycosyltransferase involved in cell wall biosynthesis
MKKLKILYTIPNFDTAGSGKVLYDLAKGLDKEHFEVHIACSHNKGAFYQEVEQLGFPIHIIETTCKYRPYISLFKRLQPYKKFIKKHQFDIVHSWHWSSDWTEVLAARLGGAKFIYTKKAMTWGNVHWKIKSYLSNFIITVNADMKAFFPNKKQQRLIPFGLDTNDYNPRLFAEVQTESIFKIITVANLVPVKHIELLIQAIYQLKHVPIHLNIVGDTRNTYADNLKHLVTDLALTSQVSFLGMQADVRPLLASSDLYVIPSKKEGMPMALVEAMAMAVPVLGSDISGIRFVLQDFDSLLFEESNVQALVDKILMIYSKIPEEREVLGQSLRSYCEAHFSMQAFITAHEKLYLELVKPTS